MFYAGIPGAFVDLAADLDYLYRALDPGFTPSDADGDRDGHRPAVGSMSTCHPVSVVSGFSGLIEYATINRAVGVLIDRGHRPDHAHAVLRRAAAAEGLALPDYAARLLEG